MRDHLAFERQLAREVDYQAGPPAMVDAMAVTRLAKTQKRGIRTMFNTTSFIGAGSVAAAAVAILLVTQPMLQEGSAPVPAASTVVEAPVPFSGTIDTWTGYEPGTYEHGSPVRTTRGQVVTLLSEFTDPRLDGVMTFSSNIDEYVSPGLSVSVATHVRQIVNDQGSWTGSSVAVGLPLDDSYRASTTTEVLYGDGAYDGLIAILESDMDDLTRTEYIEGVIVSADLPPMPDIPAVE